MTTSPQRTFNTTRWKLVVAGLLGGVGLIATVRLRPDAPQPSSPGPQPALSNELVATVLPLDRAALRERAWHKIEPRLDSADSAATGNIEHGLDDLRLFFEDRKRGTRPFAEAVLSLRGKWAMVRCKLPFTDNDGHVRFLNEKFSAHVFRPDELQAAIEGGVKAYIADLQAVENQLLVDVRADLADLPAAVFPSLSVDGALQEAYLRMADDVAVMAAYDAGVDLPRWVGSYLAGDVAARIAIRVAKALAVRLGVSAGILGAGAAGSVASFGLTVVAGIIVDQATDWVLSWFYDPVADVTMRVNQTLDRVRDLLVEGDAETPGLRQELERLNQAQARVRREALRRLVFAE